MIEVDNISIASEQKTILGPVSFKLESGDFVAITGPSGSGKSTLLRYLAQLHDPNLKVQGTYRYQDKAVEEYSTIELRKEISYCFQTASLFGQTVSDNLRFPFEIRRQNFDQAKALKLLERVQLSADFLEKEINTLSGGEKQRVALVRNVLFEPKVLLLDEVTSALDTKTRHLVWEWLDEFRRESGISVVMVSHHEEEQNKADRRIELKGQHDEVDEQLSNDEESLESKSGSAENEEEGA
ncbi:ABC transporter ATP-binding protein [Vaginisenegalia massiliensis]|uniref:ABC transporter ATP-binding protein n=1 Tax=Vaginisenegalia massiliensis TaxID=2058294 RepID=UPI000F52C43B|nr:ATP-binding cassette domain-containing protein [Vaginisenegalia massiliensis]